MTAFRPYITVMVDWALNTNSGYVVLMAGLNKMYSFISKQVQETQKQYMLILVLPIDEMIITCTFTTAR